MLAFPKDYFETEERNGFTVDAMMKRAWAAGMEVYTEVKRICDKYNLSVYAYYGTLLGAVRHKGFIPWDDDIDLCMCREDFERFKEVATYELGEFFVMRNLDNDEGHTNAILRINNGEHICFEKSFLERFHGCPYVVGVDVFPLDYLPLEEADADDQIKKIRLVLEVIASLPLIAPYDESIWKLIDSVEKMSGIKVNRDNNLHHELKVVVERLSTFCSRKDEANICHMIEYILMGNSRVPVSCFSKGVELEFENCTITAPVGYQNVLSSLYGDDYMIPKIIYETHEYPFYKKQRNSFKEVVEKEFNTKISDEQMDDLIWQKLKLAE